MKKLFEFTAGIPENISSALGWTLIHSLWQGLVIVAVFSVLRQVFKTSNARYWQGIGALSLQLVSAIVTFGMVYEPAEIAAGKPKFTAFFINNAANLDGISVFASSKLTFIQQAQLFIQNNLETFVLFWFIGANLLLLRLIIGFVYVQQLKVQKITPVRDEILGIMEELQEKIQLNIPIRLFESAKAVVPMTIGWIKPIILLPAGIMSGLSITQLEAVLAHELAHIKRYDYLINIFQSCVEILFFFHPATWFISAQVRDERENCCDDFAVEICGDRLVLAKALTQVATFQHQPRLAMAFGAKRQTFIDRIKRIVGINDAKPMSYGNWAVFVGMVLIAAMGIAYGQDRIAKNDQKSKNTSNEFVTPEEQFDFYFFEKDKKNVGVYKNKKGEIVKIVVEGKELADKEFETMKAYATQFLNAKNSNFSIIPGIVENEMDDVNEQFFLHDGYVADTSRLDDAEKEMERLGREMEKYSQEMEKYSKQMEDKYGKLMEKHGKDMEQVSLKMRVPQRKIENLSIEMQEVSLTMRKIENQYRDVRMPADAEQKLRGLEKKERDLENQMHGVEEEMRKIEEEMLPIQRKMERLNNPMDSLQRVMERYHRPMDSLGRLMEEKGKVIEKLAKEEEARFKKEFREFAEMLFKEGLIKDKKDFEIRVKGEKMLINLEPQSTAVYEKVWNWIDKTWGGRIRGMKDKNFTIEANGEHINFSTYSENGHMYHSFGSIMPPVPPVPSVVPTPRAIGRPSTIIASVPVPPAPTGGYMRTPSPVVAPAPVSGYIRTPTPVVAPRPVRAPRIYN
ncbi:M56 family metallopeptidase [Emticicia sp. BO119]|uniref:M56 family metallopeptidase n=1 Tax=Emticicia sp. BO119 TaxID=2757768 RepID=UPI0015F10CA3|nr:M56 family metallopeptidase [Emticicia sp. BO119]MBA4853737.1 M48 family metalloprotease [Emticicia sp. BO119]